MPFFLCVLLSANCNLNSVRFLISWIIGHEVSQEAVSNPHFISKKTQERTCVFIPILKDQFKSHSKSTQDSHLWDKSPKSTFPHQLKKKPTKQNHNKTSHRVNRRDPDIKTLPDLEQDFELQMHLPHHTVGDHEGRFASTLPDNTPYMCSASRWDTHWVQPQFLLHSLEMHRADRIWWKSSGSAHTFILLD